MTRTPRLCFLVALLSFLCLAPPDHAEGEGPWLYQVKKAFSEAEATNRPVFVDVWAIWCQPCKQMDETTYRDPIILEAMKQFVPLKVDQDSSGNFCERHEVEALPLVLYLDEKGREIGRRAGLQLTDDLVVSMRHVSAGYAAYLDNVDRAKRDAEAALAVADYLIDAGNPRGAMPLLKRGMKLDPSPQSKVVMALALARAQLAAGDAKAASTGFAELADSDASPEVRVQALEGLLQAQQERGREDEAIATLQRLESEFPERAARAGMSD